MGFRELRERIRGREFWRNINRSLFIGIYTVFVVGVLAFPMYLGWVLFGLVIVVPSYITFFINHLREMEKRGKGNKVIEGWVTHAYGVGERVYFYPIKFELVDKLSPDDLRDVKEYVNILGQYSEKIESGLDRFKPQQLTHKKTTEIEAMNKEEREKFDEAERKEHESYVKDHKEIAILEQNGKKEIITVKNEDESNDE